MPSQSAGFEIYWSASSSPRSSFHIFTTRSFTSPVNRDGHDRHLQMDGEYGRALLEDTWRPVNTAFAFGIENQTPPVPQPKSPCAHRGHQIRIRIHHHYAQSPG